MKENSKVGGFIFSLVLATALMTAVSSAYGNVSCEGVFSPNASTPFTVLVQYKINAYTLLNPTPMELVRTQDGSLAVYFPESQKLFSQQDLLRAADLYFNAQSADELGNPVVGSPRSQTFTSVSFVGNPRVNSPVAATLSFLDSSGKETIASVATAFSRIAQYLHNRSVRNFDDGLAAIPGVREAGPAKFTDELARPALAQPQFNHVFFQAEGVTIGTTTLGGPLIVHIPEQGKILSEAALVHAWSTISKIRYEAVTASKYSLRFMLGHENLADQADLRIDLESPSKTALLRALKNIAGGDKIGSEFEVPPNRPQATGRLSPESLERFRSLAISPVKSVREASELLRMIFPSIRYRDHKPGFWVHIDHGYEDYFSNGFGSPIVEKSTFFFLGIMGRHAKESLHFSLPSNSDRSSYWRNPWNIPIKEVEVKFASVRILIKATHADMDGKYEQNPFRYQELTISFDQTGRIEKVTIKNGNILKLKFFWKSESFAITADDLKNQNRFAREERL